MILTKNQRNKFSILSRKKCDADIIFNFVNRIKKVLDKVKNMKRL